VPLAADLVQHRAGYRLVLETGVVRENIDVGVSLPQVYWDRDLCEIEASVAGKKLEILYSRHRRSCATSGQLPAPREREPRVAA
jgi:hypothetical protein